MVERPGRIDLVDGQVPVAGRCRRIGSVQCGQRRDQQSGKSEYALSSKHNIVPFNIFSFHFVFSLEFCLPTGNRLKDNVRTQVFAGTLTGGGPELELDWVGDFAALKEDVNSFSVGEGTTRCFATLGGKLTWLMRMTPF